MRRVDASSRLVTSFEVCELSVWPGTQCVYVCACVAYVQSKHSCIMTAKSLFSKKSTPSNTIALLYVYAPLYTLR